MSEADNKTSDKNVAIEEDIELVKRYLENSAYKKSNSDFFKNGGWEMVDLEIPKAMANILAEREQKDKRIQELEEENAILKKASNIAKDVNIEDITEVMNKSYEEFISNYINKQALINTTNENGFEVYTREYGNIEVVSIDVLQELLEGEK